MDAKWAVLLQTARVQIYDHGKPEQSLNWKSKIMCNPKGQGNSIAETMWSAEDVDNGRPLYVTAKMHIYMT